MQMNYIQQIAFYQISNQLATLMPPSYPEEFQFFE